MGNPERITPLVIGLAGHKGSGKSSIAHALAEANHGTVASFGAYVRTQALSSVDPMSLAEFGANLLAKLGPEQLANNTIEASGWNGQQPLIIEGIRHSKVLDALLRRFPDLKLVHLEVPVGRREARLEARDGISGETITEIGRHSTEQEVDSLRDRAAIVVAPETLSLKAVAKKIMEKLTD